MRLFGVFSLFPFSEYSHGGNPRLAKALRVLDARSCGAGEPQAELIRNRADGSQIVLVRGEIGDGLHAGTGPRLCAENMFPRFRHRSDVKGNR